MQCLEDSLKVLWAHKTQRLAEKPPRCFRPRAIVLAGPTGCGKTDLSISLAQRLGGEIVSADSMQVYKNMDLGTAKPTVRQRDLIPHHLLDICEVKQLYNVCRFVEDAEKAINSVASRNRVPIVVGGTGFYLSSLLLGPPQGPPSDPCIRAELESQWERFGGNLAFEQLQKKDPDYAGKITRADKHKILRGLEVFALTNQGISALPWPRRDRANSIDFHSFFLHRPRDLLYRRLERRCDTILQRGLLDEVQQLLAQGLLDNSSACQAIGYKQALQFFDSSRDAAALELLRSDFKKATRHYAKRQFTWFRRYPEFQWLDLTKLGEEIALEIIACDYSMHFRG